MVFELIFLLMRGKKKALERMRGKNNNNKGMEERERIDKISS